MTKQQPTGRYVVSFGHVILPYIQQVIALTP
jgi:hypothetical protein